MRTKKEAWISAARPRTLPLSISGILVGSAYAYYDIAFAKANLTTNSLPTIEATLFNWWIPALALITTLGFQILSNFANDYGDGVKGTDNEDRIGPMRAIQSGIINPSELKKAIVITTILTLVAAILLIYTSLVLERLVISMVYLLLGIAAIWAAIKYTVGENAYGYRGLGDVFVFIFFGPVSVMGVYYLITQTLDFWLLLPSITIGLLSVAVLNLNNMRDIESDKKSNKNTIPVKLGLAQSKKLHYSYIGAACLSLAFYSTHALLKMAPTTVINLLFYAPLLAFIPLFLHINTVRKLESPALLDPELKKVALSTFLLALLTIATCLLAKFYSY